MNSSFLEPFLNLFGQVLSFFFSLVPNYGFIIVALTLSVMIIVTPLTLKATRSMMMMQQLQPEMKKLQSKYKDDRQKLNEELLKFYKENNINPVGGCLPLLIQMPVFFVLYGVLRGLTLRVPVLGADVGSVFGQQAAGVNPVQNPPDIAHFHTFQPKYLPTDGDLYQRLSETHVMNFFGMDLASSCTEVFSRQGAVYAIPYVVLIAIVGATSFIQQRQIQGRNPNAAVNPQQQQIMKIMPFFLPLISFGLPSGLVLYFAISNLYRVGQQWFIGRTIYAQGNGGPGERAPKDSSSDTPVGKGDAKAKAITVQATATNGRNGAKSTGDADKRTGGRSTATPAKASRQGTQATSPSAKAPRSSGKLPAGRTTAKKDKPAEPSSSGRGDTNGSDRKRPNSRASGPTDGAAPTLQPRARKNKKR